MLAIYLNQVNRSPRLRTPRSAYAAKAVDGRDLRKSLIGQALPVSANRVGPGKDTSVVLCSEPGTLSEHQAKTDSFSRIEVLFSLLAIFFG